MGQLESNIRSSRVVSTGLAAQPYMAAAARSAYGNRNMSHVTEPPGVSDVIRTTTQTVTRPMGMTNYVTQPSGRVTRSGSAEISSTNAPKRKER